MFVQNQPATDFSAVTPRETELARLRLYLLVGSLLYATVLLGSLVGCMYLMLKQFLTWVKALPEGVEPTWEKMMQEAPGVLYTSIACGAFSLLLAAAGAFFLLKVLGPQNRPPKKVVLTLSTLPFVVGVAGLGLPLTSGATWGAVLVFPLLVGFVISFVPVELGLLGGCLASLGLRQLRQRPKLIDSADLPTAAADYFNPFEADALEAGLMPLGDFSYLPHWKKYRRYWMAPNGAYFVDATWVSLGQSTIEAIGICSATSDGHYFETVDQPPREGSDGAEPPESLVHVTHLAGAPLAELIEAHIRMVAKWTEHAGCRPLEFAATDIHAFASYGIAAFMRDKKSDFLWLGNPYADQPLPPLPGRPWQPEESSLVDV